MVYIVTGATSFIGSKFVTALLDSGNKVYAIVRPYSSKLSYLPAHKNLHIVFEEFCNIKNITTRVSSAEIFVNFAWEGSNHKDRFSEEINNRNISNTISAMECASILGCHLFVETGSQAEYGYQNELTSETAECKPYSAYGKAKLRTLRDCSVLAKELNIAYIHFRIFSVFGEKDHDYTLFKTCLRNMRLNLPLDLTNGLQKWNFLYVDDAVSIMLEIINKTESSINPGKTEIINIASKDTRRLREYISQMKQILGSKSVLNFGAKKSERLLSLIPDISKMISIIGDDFPIRDFNQGIQQTLIEGNL